MAQKEDPYLLSLMKRCEKENKADSSIRSDGILCYSDCIYVYSEESIKSEIL